MCVVRVLCLRSCCVFVSLSCLGVVLVPRSCSGVALLLPLLCLNHFSFVFFFLSAVFPLFLILLFLQLPRTFFHLCSRFFPHFRTNKSTCNPDALSKAAWKFGHDGPGWGLPGELGLGARRETPSHGEGFEFGMGAVRATDPHGANFELVHLGVDDSWFLSWWSRDQDAAQRCRSFGLAPIQCLSVRWQRNAQNSTEKQHRVRFTI